MEKAYQGLERRQADNFKKRAYSLAEIMVVVAILAILVGIATPTFSTHILRARTSEAVATMGLIRQAEREYFSKHNNYLPVAAGNLKNDPGYSPPGLGINVGTPQYFSNAAYSVAVPGSSTHFTTAPTTPVDFVISTNGNASIQCSGINTDCAVKQTKVQTCQLEMDNTGRIFICYKNCTVAANWQAW